MDSEDSGIINFEQTELRLGLPGGGGATAAAGEIHAGNNSTYGIGIGIGKRGFLQTVDLKLNLSSMKSGKEESTEILEQNCSSQMPIDPAKPPSKAQVVGWPPVRSLRKNLVAQSNAGGGGGGGASFVKVSMDGAPYLRKLDLTLYATYTDLSHALAKMFSSFTLALTLGKCEAQGMKDLQLQNERKLIDRSEYVPTYEDKDGDWMLVGDVPWEMFVNSCRRMRIMKGSDAIGLAPRAVEKCKNRS